MVVAENRAGNLEPAKPETSPAKPETSNPQTQKPQSTIHTI